MARVESAVKAIVNGVCRGERYVTEPAWFKVTYFWKVFCPEVIEWLYRLLYITSSRGASPKDTLSKKLVDYTGAKRLIYPESIHSAAPKME